MMMMMMMTMSFLFEEVTGEEEEEEEAKGTEDEEGFLFSCQTVATQTIFAVITEAYWGGGVGVGLG